MWGNYEASLDVAELEPVTRKIATYGLQEYFIPEKRFNQFVIDMTKILNSIEIGTVNVSIRQSNRDNTTLMAWSQEGVFSFVVYYKQRLSGDAKKMIEWWTQQMIELSLKSGGTYYLPYQLQATQSQFERGYRNSSKLKKLRNEISAEKMTNTMWKKYGI